MPKRPSTDPNLFAKSVVDKLIANHDPESPEAAAVLDSAFNERDAKESTKNPAAVALVG